MGKQEVWQAESLASQEALEETMRGMLDGLAQKQSDLHTEVRTIEEQWRERLAQLQQSIADEDEASMALVEKIRVQVQEQLVAQEQLLDEKRAEVAHRWQEQFNDLSVMWQERDLRFLTEINHAQERIELELAQMMVQMKERVEESLRLRA